MLQLDWCNINHKDECEEWIWGFHGNGHLKLKLPEIRSSMFARISVPPTRLYDVRMQSLKSKWMWETSYDRWNISLPFPLKYIWQESKNSNGCCNYTRLLLLSNVIIHYIIEFQLLSFHTGYLKLLHIVIYLFVF